MVNWDADNCRCDECVGVTVGGRSSLDVFLAWITFLDSKGQTYQLDEVQGSHQDEERDIKNVRRQGNFSSACEPWIFP